MDKVWGRRRLQRVRAGDTSGEMASRITIEPGKRSGQPCIRSPRIGLGGRELALRRDDRKANPG